MLRTWQGCFLLTGIVFGLQLFPLTGVFLMMLAAPFWSVILVNLGFVLMGRDAWRDPEQRWLMLFPLLWFGGYLAVAGVSHWQANRFMSGIAAANAGQRVAFDPGRHDLVIERDQDDEANGSTLRAQTLVDGFGLTRAYERVGGGLGAYRSYEILASACPGSLVTKNSDGTTTIYLHPLDRQDNYRSSAADLCTVQDSRTPKRPTVRVRPQPQTGGRDESRVSQNVVIDAPDGTRVTLRSGRARPLTWLPQPVLGCALNSSKPAWQCFAEFRRHMPGGTSQPPAKVIAQALGLSRSTIRQRYPNAAWR